MPRAGERGEYRVDLIRADGTPIATNLPDFSFIRLGSALRPDGTGSLVPIERVSVNVTEQGILRGRPASSEDEEWWMRDNGTTIAFVRPGGRGSLGSGNVTAPMETREVTFQDMGPLMPCAFASPLQGHTFPLNVPVPVLYACDGNRPDPLRAVGVDDVNGTAAVHFNRVRGNDPSFGVWFAAGITVPIKEVDTANAGGKWGSVTYVHRLVGYEAGPASRVPLAQAAVPPPPWTTAERQTWGMDPATAFPFSLQEAWVKASQDSGSDFSGFLKNHPGAVMVEAGLISHSRQTEPWNNGLERQVTDTWWWGFSASDAKDCIATGYAKMIHRRQILTSQGPIDEPQEPVGLLGRPAVEYMRSTSRSCLPIDSSSLPSQVPTVEALWARWELIANVDKTTNAPEAWGFSFRCVGAATPCRPTYWAGIDATNDTRTGSNRTVDFVRSKLNLGANGELLGAEYARARLASGPPVPAGVPGGPAAALNPPGNAAWPLNPAAAATGSLLGLLVGGAYYLWPTARAGVAGLFSRIQPGDALDNPKRRAIMDAITAHPGIHYRELLRTLGFSKGVLEHHVGKLRAAGLIQVQHHAGLARMFLRTATVTAPLQTSHERVLAAMQPRGTVRALARATGLAPSTVSYHLQRMVAAGQVRQDGEAYVRA
ncbi:MAG: winged helix-turn-helix transcriptional regulator [Thermoplasmatota archaeon]